MRWHYCYMAMPLLVVLPGSAQEVQAVLRFCNEKGVKIVPRGSGTSLSGGALPLEDGVLLVTSRLCNVLAVDEHNRVARVQPGVPNIKITEPSAILACATCLTRPAS